MVIKFVIYTGMLYGWHDLNTTIFATYVMPRCIISSKAYVGYR